jgi:hypothetical protein
VFVQVVYGSRFRSNVSPDLQLNSYIQYDNDLELIATNTRLRGARPRLRFQSGHREAALRAAILRSQSRGPA